ncbi:MAG TPA: hypothetical protein VKE40_10635 [Gemmataceae bacterium]|nr:hypothetical protein [Gemmataceae bacterium]
MTEAEWIASTDPELLIEFIRPNVTERKLRLFAATRFAQLIDLLPHDRQHRGIHLLEQMGDGTAAPNWRLEARRDVLVDYRGGLPTGDHSRDDPDHVALMLYRAIVSSDAAGHAAHATRGIINSNEKQAEQCEILRDVLSNPFRPVAVDPRWRTADVAGLARAIYEDKAFDRLPILADALMDAGCADEQVLAHCRGEGPHVRGCWVVDLVLDRR